jgi:hypothetical protein
MARSMKPVELAERMVMVFKTIEDLDTETQRDVLRATLRMLDKSDKKGDEDGEPGSR